MQRSYLVGGRSFEVFFGDITDLPVDALVNSENSDLRMDAATGASVSAAIRRIEGEGFAAETESKGPLELGRALAMPASKLRARFVIHAASVRKLAGERHETTPEAIGSAVRASLAVASSLGLRSVALPAFGVRAAKVPREVASEVMIDAIFEHLSKPTSLERIVLALLDPQSFIVFFERAIIRAKAAEQPLVLHLERQGDDLLARFEDQGAVTTVTRSGSCARDLDHARERLDRLARSSERTLAAASSELRATGGFVWSFLLPESARERLAATPARTLVLRTDDALAAVPWELAWDGEAFLSERFAVARGLVAETAPARRSPPRSSLARRGAPELLVLAAPTGDLPAASRESETLLALLFAKGARAELLGGERATRARVLERLAEAQALHFAGHCRRSPSGLAWPLAVGELTPEDARSASALRLVFANSCAPLASPAAPGPEERLGVGRAFLLAGVETFVGTLWEVQDRPARTFAIEAWTRLLEGASVGEALHRARAAGRALGTVDWAAYVHFGDPLARPFAT